MMNGNFPQNDYSRVIFTVMKDEGPFILEWISYHLAIGFTHFVVLTNDCSDGTEKILKQLEKLGLVTHKNNPAPHPKGPQKTGYVRMRKLEAFQKADWMMTLDCDEFLRIDVGNGHLDDLFKVVGPNVKGISFLWQLFGNNEQDHLNEDLIIGKFTKASHPLQSRPYEARSFKTLYRNGYFDALGTHRPIGFDKEKMKEFLWIDANGIPLTPFLVHRFWNAQENGFAFGTCLGRINHYALRSLDSFMVKWMRGFVHPTAPTVRGKGTPIDYWRLFHWEEVEETRITAQIDTTRQIRNALLNELNLKSLSKKSYAWHEERAAELRKTNSDIFEALRALPPSKVDEDLPDFSAHGCPPIGARPYIDLDVLRVQTRYSVLAPEHLSALAALSIPK